eukprot:1214351-Prymnesium_polylepis.1
MCPQALTVNMNVLATASVIEEIDDQDAGMIELMGFLTSLVRLDSVREVMNVHTRPPRVRYDAATRERT